MNLRFNHSQIGLHREHTLYTTHSSSVYLGFSPVDSATVFKVSLTLIDQEGVVSGHLICRTSPGGLMNIHEAIVGGLGAFMNAAFHSTPVE